MEENITIEFAGRPLTLSAGGLAKQADGSVLARYGDTVVLVTAVAEKQERDKDFLPLTVNYQEMSYAAGKFPGGFFKREGRPTTREILTSRLIDRPLRPLFPKNWRYETQVISTVLSADQDNDPGVLSLVGASCAVTISDIPHDGPFAGVRVGRIGGVFVANPTFPEMADSDIDIVVTATRDAIIMVEGEAHFVKGTDLIEAIEFGHQAMMPLIEMQEKLREKIGRPKRQIPVPQDLEEKKKEVRAIVEKDLIDSFGVKAKLRRYERQDAILNDLKARYSEEEAGIIAKVYEDVTRDLMREQLLSTGRRIDGRVTDEIRPISCVVGALPRTHGSAVFTRGETQALAVTTFGTSDDEQKIESLHEGETYKTFLLHYNFTPFSVGEVSMLRGPTRREIGHGNLAERALTPILPERRHSRTRSGSFRRSSSRTVPLRWPRYAAAAFRSWTPACPSRSPLRASPWAS